MGAKDVLIPKSSSIVQQKQTANPYIHLGTSENTRKAYRSDIRHFENWGGKLPATSQQITEYLNFYADKINSRTLERRIVALSHWHHYQNFNDPTRGSAKEPPNVLNLILLEKNVVPPSHMRVPTNTEQLVSIFLIG